MKNSGSSILLLALLAVFLFFRLRARVRPAPVRPDRAFLYAGLVALGTLAGVAGSYHLLLTPLGAALVPVMIAVGAALGVWLARSMTFYTGPDGQLWSRGGVLFIGIFLGLLFLRLGVRYAAGGGSLAIATGSGARLAAESPTLLNILSADLLFVSIGLWGARAHAIWRRHREFERTRPIPHPA